jgi:serine/threonine-protein kinase
VAGVPTQQTARALGRYVLFDEVAHGGMATVHLGRLRGPIGFSRTVAIKRLHPQFAKDPEIVAMFVDEARLAARVQHPNVVSTLDVVSLEDELFLVMEYVPGESLARIVRPLRQNGEGVPPAIAASILVGTLHGLHAAHEAKSEKGESLDIVHRDVSPQNVLLGADGVARVVDFGIAKAVGRSQTTREGQIKGKAAYMAPEQLAARPVDRRVDVYAAAVMLWELLAGRRLFQGDNPLQVMRMVLELTIEPPSRFVPTVPETLDAVVLKGAARDAGERYATAREMAVALERAVLPATTREVGEWVEAIAGEGLRKRAARVHEIESASYGEPPALAQVPAATESPASRAPSEAIAQEGRPAHTQLSNVSVTHTLVDQAGRPKNRRALLVGGVAAVVGASLGSIVLLGRSSPDASPSTAATAGVSAGGSGAPVTGATGGAPAPGGSTTLVGPTTGASTVPAPSSVPGRVFAPARPPFRSSPSSFPAPNCNPPFTWSADGKKKIPKPECF